MTAEKTYQGWTNYETWSVALMLDNEQGSYSYWREVSQELLDEAGGADLDARRSNAASELATRLKDAIEEGNPLAGDTTLYGQLLTGAISEVNWYEIAEHWLDELEPTEEV